MRARLKIWSLRISIALVCAIVLVVAGLMTTAGQRAALSLAGQIASSKDVQVKIGRLNGSLLESGHIEEISIADGQGVWLDIRNIRYRWSALSLLSGRLIVDDFHVEAIEIARKPVAADKPAKKSDGSAPSLIPIALKKVRIDNLILGEALAGAPARFAIEAAADLLDHRKGLSAKISASRLDQPGAKVAARFNFVPEQRDLSVRVSASEPADGLLAMLLGLPKAPALSFELVGDGTLDAWQSKWSASASGQPFVIGRARIDRDGARHRLATDFTGYVQALAPASISELVAGKTTGSLIGFARGFDQVDLTHILLKSDAIDLRGSAGLISDVSHFHGSLSARIARADGRPVHFALSNGDEVSLGKLDLKLDIPKTQSARDVSLDIAAAELKHPSGNVSKIDITARLTQSKPVGKTAFDADRIAVKLTTSGLSGLANGLSEAIAPIARAKISGSFKAGVLSLDEVRVGDEKTYLAGSGRLSRTDQSGTAKLVIPDLSLLSGLYGKPIEGRASIAVKAEAKTEAETFSVTFDGTSNELSLGQDALAGIIGPKLKFSGALARERSGRVQLTKLDVAGANVTLTASGHYSDDAIELDHHVEIPNLAAVQPDIAGVGRLEGRLSGSPSNLISKIRLTTRDIAWRGHTVEGLHLGFDGKGPITGHNGRFELAGRIGPHALASRAQLTLASAGTFAARDFTFAFGPIQAAGDLSLGPNKIPSGSLKLDAANLSPLAVLIGKPISGGLTGRLELSEHRSAPRALFDLAIPSLKVGKNAIKGAKASGDLQSYMTAIKGHASLNVAGLSGDGMKAKKVSLSLREAGGRMTVTGTATLNDADVDLAGSFAQDGPTTDIIVDRIRMQQGALKVRLQDPARLKVTDTALQIGKLRLLADSGRIDIEGTAGRDAVKIDATVAQLPARLANTFVPSLGLDGSISGRATVRGKPENPTASFNATWSGASAQVLRENHLPSATVKLAGDLRNGAASAKLDIAGPQSLSLSVVGDAAIKSRTRLNFRITGDIPLALVNASLSARATRISGRASITGTVKGTPEKPNIAMRVSIPNGAVHDPASGLKLKRLVGLIDVTERGVEIRKLTGESDLGGTVTLDGKVSVAERSAVALQLTLADLKFNDRQMIAGEVDGKLRVSGDFEALSANGSIYIRRMDVTVPASAPSSVTSLNVRHVNAPARLKARREPADRQKKPAPPIDVALNVRIDAANRIFVKGRGLDALLGGGLKIQGRGDAPVADGAFQMVRGRLDILGRRLEFRHGRISFDGTLEPMLDMQAAAVADDVTIIVTITGPASKPVFKFSSEPELPEEEVIARLLFNKELVGLSPLQLVQLASEVDKIGGLSSGPGILEKLKSSVGVDVLDISTDKTGAATVSAGSYVTEKTFVGVRQGTNTTSSRVVIDHELTKNLKARGEAGADGNSKLGIGFELNY